MPVTQRDIHLLEAWLDGDEGCAALRSRIEHEPELAEALTRLRAGRAVRRRAMALSFADDAALAQLVSAGRQRVAAQARGWRLFHAVAGAACLTLGLGVGIAADRRSPAGPIGMSGDGVVEASNISFTVEPQDLHIVRVLGSDQTELARFRFYHRGRAEDFSQRLRQALPVNHPLRVEIASGAF